MHCSIALRALVIRPRATLDTHGMVTGVTDVDFGIWDFLVSPFAFKNLLTKPAGALARLAAIGVRFGSGRRQGGPCGSHKFVSAVVSRSGFV